MKKILVPVDFSIPSENALKVAAKLAIKNKAELHILHVIELAESLFGTEQFNVDNEQILFFMKMANKKFVEFLDKDYLKDVSIVEHVEPGSPSRIIRDVVEKNDIDMVVIGSSGASGLKEIVVGSNTEKVVRFSEVPVMVIKKELKNIDFKNAAFASNFNFESMEAFRTAKVFIDSFNAKMQLLYINLPGNQFYSTAEIKDHIKNFLDKMEVPLTSDNVEIYNDYSTGEGILNGARSLKADLIVIPTHGRKGISHFFNGSVGEDVVNHSELPVLTLKI
jgi:nucleotide-binding universal stress UspA family protein